MGSHPAILPYKEAQVYNSAKDWFVFFSYYCRKKKRYVRKKVRLNHQRVNPEHRQAVLESVCNDLNKVIRFRNSKGIFHEDVAEPEALVKSTDTLVSCAEHYKEHLEISESTRKNIGYFLYSYNAFLKANSLYRNISPASLDGRFIKHFIKFLQDQGKTGKTINSYLWAIQLITERLLLDNQLDTKFDVSPYRVKQVKNESGLFRPLTHEEKTLVFDHFRERRPQFYLYLLSIYYTCIRPAELRRLKISYFDLQGMKIQTPWFTSKNGLSNHVQLFGPLKDALIDLGIDKIQDRNQYLFSRLFEPGKELYKGKWASDIWRAGCDKLNISKDANMYGLKHTFNVDYVENNKYNIDWEFLRRHNRHATVQQTQDYISGLTAYFLDETKSVIINYHQ